MKTDDQIIKEKKMHLIGREAQDGLKNERKKPNMSLALLVNIM